MKASLMSESGRASLQSEVDREPARSDLSTVRCVSCRHQVSSVGRRDPQVVFCVVISTSRNAHQSRVCFEYEVQ